MKSIKHCFSSISVLMLAAGVCLSAGNAMAADSTKQAGMNATIQQERENCMNGNTNQDRATCLREAGAARQESQRGNLHDNSDYAANATKRCAALPDAERSDCERRAKGEGSISGSVGSGGVVREVVTPVPAGQQDKN